MRKVASLLLIVGLIAGCGDNISDPATSVAGTTPAVEDSPTAVGAQMTQEQLSAAMLNADSLPGTWTESGNEVGRGPFLNNAGCREWLSNIVQGESGALFSHSSSYSVQGATSNEVVLLTTHIATHEEPFDTLELEAMIGSDRCHDITAESFDSTVPAMLTVESAPNLGDSAAIVRAITNPGKYEMSTDHVVIISGHNVLTVSVLELNLELSEEDSATILQAWWDRYESALA